jgi:hypothetical protein
MRKAIHRAAGQLTTNALPTDAVPLAASAKGGAQ